jgi:hypothetical protein
LNAGTAEPGNQLAPLAAKRLALRAGVRRPRKSEGISRTFPYKEKKAYNATLQAFNF